MCGMAEPASICRTLKFWNDVRISVDNRALCISFSRYADVKQCCRLGPELVCWCCCPRVDLRFDAAVKSAAPRLSSRRMDALGRAAMLQAAAQGDWSTVVRMFETQPPAESAAAASAADLFGRTTWHWLAAAAPRSTAVDLVRHLQAPIAASARTKSQENVLHWLFDSKRVLVDEDCVLCRAFVAAGADPLERNTDGLSAIDLLRSRVEASRVDASIAARCLSLAESAADTAGGALATAGDDTGSRVAPLSTSLASAGSVMPSAGVSVVGGKKKLTVKLKK